MAGLSLDHQSQVDQADMTIKLTIKNKQTWYK
jgi:hypothetical protein